MWKIITNRYNRKCYRCYRTIPKGTEVEWNPESHKIRHVTCCKKTGSINARDSGRTPTGRRARFVS